MAKKKKKQSSAELHRQVKDSLQALPYVVEQQRQQGHPVKAFMLRYFSAPVLKLINKTLNAKRYRGEEGAKLKQTEIGGNYWTVPESTVKAFTPPKPGPKPKVVKKGGRK